MLSGVVLKNKSQTLNLEGGLKVFPRKILKTNKAGEAISGHILRAILPSVNEQFERILLSFTCILYAVFKRNAYVCISLVCRYLTTLNIDIKKSEHYSEVNKPY